MVPIVRRRMDRQVFRRLWIQAESRQDGASCPSCRKPMRVSSVDVDDGLVVVDTCRSCQLFWFDNTEAETVVPTGTNDREERIIDAKALFLMKESLSRSIRAERRHRSRLFPNAIFAALGLPVEDETELQRLRSWMTWGCALLLLLVHGLILGDMNDVFSEWGFKPADAFRHFGATFVTPFFLHAGWFHLVGNAYFLLVFGDDVEHALGRLKYLGLLLGGSVLGVIAHGLFTSRPEVVLVGASAGISAVLVFYALAFPKNRIGLVIRYRYFTISARVACLCWLAEQGVGATMQYLGRSSVSAAAHIGGAAFGVVVWLVWSRRIDLWKLVTKR